MRRARTTSRHECTPSQLQSSAIPRTYRKTPPRGCLGSIQETKTKGYAPDTILRILLDFRPNGLSRGAGLHGGLRVASIRCHKAVCLPGDTITLSICYYCSSSAQMRPLRYKAAMVPKPHQSHLTLLRLISVHRPLTAEVTNATLKFHSRHN
jgi:hypothetical protein